jgi:hypothetical protein
MWTIEIKSANRLRARLAAFVTLGAASIAVAACATTEPNGSQGGAISEPGDASDEASDGAAWDSGVEGTTCTAQPGAGACPGSDLWVTCTTEPQPFVPDCCASTHAQDIAGYVSFCCAASPWFAQPFHDHEVQMIREARREATRRTGRSPPDRHEVTAVTPVTNGD